MPTTTVVAYAAAPATEVPIGAFWRSRVRQGGEANEVQSVARLRQADVQRLWFVNPHPWEGDDGISARGAPQFGKGVIALVIRVLHCNSWGVEASARSQQPRDRLGMWERRVVR